MIYNGVDFGEYCKVETVVKNLHPDNIVLTKAIPGQHGEKFIKRTLGVGTIKVGIRIIGDETDDIYKKARIVAGLLSVDKPKELTFKREPEKSYMAILSGETELHRFLHTGGSALTFCVPDPLAYSESRTVNISNTIVNLGTHKTTGVITISMTSNQSFLKVTLQETGEYLYLEDTFKNGDTVVIDLGKEYVTKNGVSLMSKLHFESDFFHLPKGPFKINASSGVGTLQFMERWL